MYPTWNRLSTLTRPLVSVILIQITHMMNFYSTSCHAWVALGPESCERLVLAHSSTSTNMTIIVPMMDREIVNPISTSRIITCESCIDDLAMV